MEIRGLVMTMFDARISLAQQVVEEVKRHFPGKVFDAIIPRSVRLAEAPSHGVPITIYAPTSSGAQAYRALAEEVLNGDRPAQEPQTPTDA
jgi:chromosome partitioning protein